MLWCMFVAVPCLIGLAVLVGPPSVLLWVIAGGASYIVGALVVTFVFNIPMNERLDRMDYRRQETASYWRSSYLPSWTFWSGIRAAMTGMSAICFSVAVVLLAGAG